MQQPFKIQQMDELKIIDDVMETLETKRPDLHDLIQARKVYSYLLVFSRIMSSGNKTEYIAQKREVERKIISCRKGVLVNRNVKLSWKIRLLSFDLGDSCFYAVDKIMNSILHKVRNRLL